jgi:predicted nucleic acid-binding protein
VPAPVLVEVAWLMSRRLGESAFDTVLASVEDGGIEVENLTGGDYARARQLLRRYADLPLGFVDAAIVAVAERLREGKLASLDRRHLGVVRPRHVRSFTLLPAG